METAADNEMMTRVGPGTPGGALLRQYWQPVALIEELAGERPVKTVRLMAEDFVLFRDEQGRYGMLDRHCPHRAADLAYGRLENGGLRCLFHGWLFDVEGKCLETPAEPPNVRLCDRVKQAAYPVTERAGILFAFIGKGEPPAFPDFDCFVAPDEYIFAFKGLFECNWLQALEVGIDPSHASYLHRFFEDGNPAESYGKQFRGTSSDSDVAITTVLREYDRPTIQVDATPYGMRLTALRELDSERTHVRVTNLVFPQAFVIPMSSEMTIAQWHVPVDDTHCYWYAIFTSFGAPVDKAQMRAQRLELYELPDYTSRRNRRNNYGYDIGEQLTETYTGMGHDINVHDQWAVESQGAIQDRTREHLGTADKAIVRYRRMLKEAIRAVQRGETTTMMLSPDEAKTLNGPPSIDGVSAATEVATYWQDADQRRRATAGWAASVTTDAPAPKPASRLASLPTESH
ncbi:aromatic ring-hydroxylating dioxygenase subunit alpha [Burkholderia gladioli pv. gladioli]|uniref:Rieske [2Fe-2S] domain protein n=1 Tax=Burkholderia gladioli TaxID=28095 RepID=A0A095HDW3_BURGA|nr:aromatic ring-hydroxylating dioxygenase subunit alpha [Burkholderia gladioli]AJW97753.1 rieske [2Fe-2S] domain protein [Burkholderia gladioli]ASD79882.1 ring-hydroxylating oxygenase subunit alpha [Burkholderia gladioli pv. gladioli]AWY54876.1 ring-hydroxylating oxygenase subunit alpha [Burkholderia gladioli pv. gladioli]KGC11754.1 rieske [2Fe-2S] domain protein [Burkholderia gladioli]MDJ1164148.1 aromatic ring-hydroxylating dioxygenase subunit alpha [Burkholderia gladioli pv. gladioli]